MMKKKRRDLAFWAVLVILLAAAAGTAIWLLAPRNLAEIVDTAAPVELRVQRYDRESVELTVEPGTPEMEALADVLARHTYHLHWTALFGSTGVQSYVSDTYRILYDQITICGSGKRSYQFGGELTWFQRKDASDPEGRRDRVLLLDHWGQTQGDDLRWELLTALGVD